jgi:large subunit ribosomal protein L21
MMMYAVVQTGGKQVKLTPGDVVRVESLDAPVGDTVELGEVKLLAGESGLVVDPKQLAGAKVVCKVTAHGRGKKIRVFKYKRRKNYSRTRGHRQNYTQLKVQDIVA